MIHRIVMIQIDNMNKIILTNEEIVRIKMADKIQKIQSLEFIFTIVQKSNIAIFY
jgi:hypothetical protein